MTANEVRYRENAASCNIESLPAGQEAPFAAAAMSTSSAMSSTMSSAWSSEATAPPTLDSSASSEPTTTTSMTYDDGSYHWSAPPPAVTSAGAQAVWKRQAGSMMQGDPFLLSTPSAPSITSATQVSSTVVVLRSFPVLVLYIEYLVNAHPLHQRSGSWLDRACSSDLAGYPRLLDRFHRALLLDLLWRAYRRLVPLERSVYVFQRVSNVDKCIV